MNRDAIPVTRLWVVIPDREVLCTAVIPKRDRVDAPPESTLEVGFGTVLKEEREQGVAFGDRKFLDPRRKAFVYVECLSSGRRMRADYWVLRSWVLTVAHGPAAVTVAVVLVSFVHRRET